MQWLDVTRAACNGSAFLAPWLGRQANTVPQQLREFC